MGGEAAGPHGEECEVLAQGVVAAGRGGPGGVAAGGVVAAATVRPVPRDEHDREDDDSAEQGDGGVHEVASSRSVDVATFPTRWLAIQSHLR